MSNSGFSYISLTKTIRITFIINATSLGFLIRSQPVTKMIFQKFKSELVLNQHQLEKFWVIFIWCEKVILKLSAYGHLELLVLVTQYLKHFSMRKLSNTTKEFSVSLWEFKYFLLILSRIRNETESWVVGETIMWSQISFSQDLN